MEAKTLEKIEALIAAAAGQALVSTNGFGIIVPTGSSLVDVEKFQRSPRAHRQTYRTERTLDFIRYVTENSNEKTCLYIHPQGEGATAIIDHGAVDDPQWAHHRAVLALRHTPAWLAAKRICQGAHAQQTLVDFLQDWPGHLSAHKSDGEEIQLSRAIAAVRRVKITAGAVRTATIGDMANARSAMETIEASSEVGLLPAYFVMQTPIYVGQAVAEVVLHLSVRTDDKACEPRLALRIVGEEMLAEAEATALEEILQSKSGIDKKNIFVGEVERTK